MDSLKFGNPDFHYSSPYFSYPKLSATTSSFKSIIENIDSEAQKNVSQAINRWNNYIRDNLRNELGFRIYETHSGKRHYKSIPIQNVTYLPPELESLLNNIDPIFWKYLLRKDELIVTNSILKSFMDDYDYLIRSNDIFPDDGKSNISRTTKIIDEFLENIRLDHILLELKKIPSDCLGAYYFRSPRIHIFWLAVAFYSRILNCSVEELTFITLAHELTHAYTHLGLDMDNNNWNTDVLAISDLEITEGLAQYYTELLCKKNDHLPNVSSVFDQLQGIQADYYSCFHEWRPDHYKGSINEIVRLALINTRNSHICDYNKFKEEIENAQKNLK